MEPCSKQPDCDNGSRPTGRFGVLLEIGSFVLLAGFLAFSFFSGRIVDFVKSEFVWFPLATSIAVFAMACARLRAFWIGSGSCEDDEEEETGHVSRCVCVSLLILPVVMALTINPTGFSSEGRKKRQLAIPLRDAKLERAIDWVLGIELDASKIEASDFSLSKEPTLLEMFNALGEGYGEQMDGRFVTLVGQCDTTSSDPTGRFDLYRLIVNCCIADASSVSVEVIPPPGVKLEPNGWLKASGILRFDSPISPSLPVLHATTITKIAVPREPYL